jgi:hypothetical protein
MLLSNERIAFWMLCTLDALKINSALAYSTPCAAVTALPPRTCAAVAAAAASAAELEYWSLAAAGRGGTPSTTSGRAGLKARVFSGRGGGILLRTAVVVQADSASKRNGAPGAQRLNQLEKKETERSS